MLFKKHTNKKWEMERKRKMKKYEVTITETLKRKVVVEAENLEDAKKVTDEWYKGEYVLEADDFVSVNFKGEEKEIK